MPITFKYFYGTPAGGAKAAKTNRKLHGEDFYTRIGSKGGSAFSLKPKGFAANPERARWAGRLGGLTSRKGVPFESLEVRRQNAREIFEKTKPKENERIYLERCPKCGKENYAPSVATGRCVWCGYRATEADIDGKNVFK